MSYESAIQRLNNYLGANYEVSQISMRVKGIEE